MYPFICQRQTGKFAQHTYPIYKFFFCLFAEPTTSISTCILVPLIDTYCSKNVLTAHLNIIMIQRLIQGPKRYFMRMV